MDCRVSGDHVPGKGGNRGGDAGEHLKKQTLNYMYMEIL